MASRIVPIMDTSTAAQPLSTSPTALKSPTAEAVTTELAALTAARPSVRLAVPIDTSPRSRTTATAATRTLRRRDSLEHRDALLRGKEGTRARRRYDNAHMLDNPWAEPPLPSDWEVKPTYPVRRIPYYLAPLWDAAEFQRAVEGKLKGRRSTGSGKKHKRVEGLGVSPFEDAASSVPKEVRGRLKHARSAKGLLQDLEEDVRAFLKKWNERELRLREEGLHDVPSAHAVVSDTEGEDEEEIVFVGRAGAVTHDSPGRKKREEEENLVSEKLVFEGLEDDRGAGFGRWLTHCIGSYYGLRTWSVTVDGIDEDGAVDDSKKVRQAYVGVDARVRGWMGRGAELGREFELPRPLWAMV